MGESSFPGLSPFDTLESRVGAFGLGTGPTGTSSNDSPTALEANPLAFRGFSRRCIEAYVLAGHGAAPTGMTTLFVTELGAQYKSRGYAPMQCRLGWPLQPTPAKPMKQWQLAAANRGDHSGLQSIMDEG